MQTAEEQLKVKMKALFDLPIYPLVLKEILKIEGEKNIHLVVKEPEEFEDFQRYTNEHIASDRTLKIVNKCQRNYSLLDDKLIELKREFGGRGFSFSVCGGLFGPGVRYFVTEK